MQKITAIILKLRCLILSAKLRKLTSFQRQMRNIIRCTSLYSLTKRYVKLREYQSLLEPDDIDDVVLSASENRRVNSILKQLHPLESVTKALQRDSTAASYTRASFDAVIEKYRNGTNRSTSSADIMLCPNFECSIAKN